MGWRERDEGSRAEEQEAQRELDDIVEREMAEREELSERAEVQHNQEGDDK
jgi:hypothetical protein